MNPRLPEPQSGALATELYPPCKLCVGRKGRSEGLCMPVSKPFAFQKALKLARPQGFEPWTYGLEGRCSILLSYRRTLGPLGLAAIGLKSHTADINVFYQKAIRLSRAKKERIRYNMKGFTLTFGRADCIIDPISAVSGRAAQPCPQKRAASLG